MTFQRSGISFRYPEDWGVEQQDEEAGWTGMFQSPGTSFALVTFWEGAAVPGELADSALEAMREEYSGLEEEPVVETLAGQAAVGYDVDFLALDLPVTAKLRAIVGGEGTALVLCQGPDAEEELAGQAFRDLFASLSVDDGPE